MRGRTYLKVVIGFWYVEVLENQLAEFIGIMLTSVNECVGDVVCDTGTDERREYDDFRAGAKDYHYIVHFEY